MRRCGSRESIVVCRHVVVTLIINSARGVARLFIDFNRITLRRLARFRPLAEAGSGPHLGRHRHVRGPGRHLDHQLVEFILAAEILRDLGDDFVMRVMHDFVAVGL